MTSNKQPFKLPSFYVPCSARLNPNLEAARAHSKAWAYEMGILVADEEEQQVVVWSDRKFDAMDIALMCAYGHPDADQPMLNLVTDWYVWAFFTDDRFVEVYKRSQDMASAKEHIARLLTFMPVHKLEFPLEPIDPVERGLADLWSRTAPNASVDWLLRFCESTTNALEAPLWEIANINQNRIANPIEYIEMRRQVGAAPWSADLIEHAVGAEIPAAIAHTRPMRVLKDTFADTSHLQNDIFSYQREKQEGENTNCVMVIESFLNCDPQKAANLTNDLLTSRLQQFENTALTEVPLLCEEYGLSPEERVKLLLYTKGLREWYAGSYEWHMTSSRYMNQGAKKSWQIGGMAIAPTGLGTSAVRVASLINSLGLKRFKSYDPHIPHPVTEPFEMPEPYMPYTPRLNPHVDAVRKHTKAWAKEMGLIGLDCDTWNEQRFDANHGSLSVAYMYPDLSLSELELASDWVVWTMFLDDDAVVLYGRGRLLSLLDLARAKQFFDRLMSFMSSDSTAMPIPNNRVEFALANLWSRTAPSMSKEGRCRFSNNIKYFFEGQLWELHNLSQNRIPDPIDYFEMRRNAFAIDFIEDLRYGTVDLDIPAEILDAKTIRTLKRAVGDCAVLGNDIVSYHNEIEREGNLNNGILVIQRFLDCSLQEAVNVVNDLAIARLQQFEKMVVTELPTFFDSFELNPSTREAILEYIKTLENFIAGGFEWYIKTNRYNYPGKDADITAQRGLCSPSGLGTASTVIGSSSVPQKTTEADVAPIVQNILSGPTGLGTAATKIASSAVPEETTKPNLTPIVQKLLRGPTGLGTAATKIASSAVPEEKTEPVSQPMVQKLLKGPTGLGTSAADIRSLLGTKV